MKIYLKLNIDTPEPENPSKESPVLPQTEEVLIADDNTKVGNSTKVILFNDEWHTFEEVVNQLIKAIKCSESRAEELTWEVHTKGKACVYDGDLDDCLRISDILEEIGLHTQIEY
jgi:ATP-dependent Clp protease adaptor protein ClpS